MFVRFVTPALDEESGRRQGVFIAAYRLRRSGSLSLMNELWLDQLLNWFERHLEIPDRFSRSGRKDAGRIAISWYKDSATECVRRMYAMCGILNEHGILTEKIKSPRPGYVVFEDEQQVTAIP